MLNIGDKFHDVGLLKRIITTGAIRSLTHEPTNQQTHPITIPPGRGIETKLERRPTWDIRVLDIFVNLFNTMVVETKNNNNVKIIT